MELHYNQQPHDSNDDERQFNWPGFIGGQILGHTANQLFGPPQGPGPGGPFPGGPGSGPGFGQGQGFPGGGQNSAAPNSPPPGFTPAQPQYQTFAVDPGAIQGCMYRFTYVWLRRDSFWFYPVFVGRRSVAGYRWIGFRWVYTGIDLNTINSFQCF